MIPIATLYYEYIDPPKLSEQKKPIWVYSSSPPQEGTEQKKFYWSTNSALFVYFFW